MEYKIDENLAKLANEMNSFREYKEDSATNEYGAYLSKFNAEIEDLKGKAKYTITPEISALIDYWSDRYAKKLAYAINLHNSIECRCPSIMISGGSNFNCRAKQKQNNARSNFWEEYGELFEPTDNYYFKKIKNILLSNTIYSSDELAVEKLEDEIKELKDKQELMKNVNTYFRKNKTLNGCELLSEGQIEKLQIEMARFRFNNIPFEAYMLTNNNANIHRLESRLESLKKIKERTNEDTQNDFESMDGVEVVEDKDEMRIQLIFDDIPPVQTRDVLKHNGFRWSPKNKAWQRLLNQNGIYAVKKVLKILKGEE